MRIGKWGTVNGRTLSRGLTVQAMALNLFSSTELITSIEAPIPWGGGGEEQRNKSTIKLGNSYGVFSFWISI